MFSNNKKIKVIFMPQTRILEELIAKEVLWASRDDLISMKRWAPPRETSQRNCFKYRRYRNYFTKGSWSVVVC